MNNEGPELATIGIEEMQIIRRGLNSAVHLMTVIDEYLAADRSQETVSRLIGLHLLCRIKVDEALRMTERARILRSE